MKIVLQHDERDCGAACLAMIAAHYKLYLPISRCRELTKTDRAGANLYGIIDSAKQIGLNAKALSGSPDELMTGIQSGEITFPLIAHIITEDAMLHYVVILGLKNGAFIIGDPGRGKQNMSLETFFNFWTGYIVTFNKTSAFQPGNYTKSRFLKFFGLLKGQWGRLAGVVLSSLALAAIGIVGAFVFQIVIDNFAFEHYAEYEHTQTYEADSQEQEIEEKHTHEGESELEQLLETFAENSGKHLSFIFTSLLFLYLLHAVIQFLRGCLIIQISRKIDMRLTLQYYYQIVDLPISSLSMRQTGEYLSRFSDTASIRQAISSATVTLLMDTLMVIVGGLILFHESPRLFAITLGMIVCYALLVMLYRRPVEQSNRKVMEEDAKLQSYLKETIDGMETIKAANANEQIKNRTADKFNRFLNAVVNSSKISVSQDTLAETIEMIGTVLILWAGFGMTLTGQITVGTLMTFYALIAYFTEPIKNLIELQPSIQTAFVAADRLNDILELKSEKELTTDSAVGKKADSVTCWEIRHVDFRYGNHELTLHDVNFRINQGQRIAIVGESGSGKTTLAKLFLRFYEPEIGEVLLDECNISEYNLHDLRKNIAYVGQNTFLFSDSIRNNIALGISELTENEMDHICELSKTADFIHDLPLGYDTPLEENGTNLSGGQRQRLAIARALARHPQLLILDEATSNLDTVTENSIRDTIFNLNRNMTCIIIAHRLTTIRNCDLIYVMKDGSVAETGTYEELMKIKGEFYRLWNAM